MRATLRLVLFGLVAAFLFGCSQGPSGTEGQTVNVSDLNKKNAAGAAAGGVAPPSPPSDGSPGTAAR